MGDSNDIKTNKAIARMHRKSPPSEHILAKLNTPPYKPLSESFGSMLTFDNLSFEMESCWHLK